MAETGSSGSVSRSLTATSVVCGRKGAPSAAARCRAAPLAAPTTKAG
ncbi:hypothetical protein [Nonomuraea turcica]|nr:hypothetical protein [Nonomuraea sp. G32]MDP4509703.1 hypothetical protein [Nonomuraea sp. G32]